MSWNNFALKGRICLFALFLSVVAVVLFALSVVFASRNDHLSVSNYADNQDDDYVQCRTFPSTTNRTDFITVSLSSTTQRLRGKIVLEQRVKVAQFLSVPYADKPKRFRKSEPVPSWSGVRDALHWPNLCMQNNVQQFEYLTKILNYSVSEDCLYLNIWSPHPHLVRLANRTNKVRSKEDLLPVVVFIHGGAFNYMGVSFEAYYGGVIAALGKVVFVTINYRVGAFGFFNNHLEQHNELYTNNVGLYDQIAAIEWVKDNIHHFGGNPKLITLQGQSAGAICIGLLMLSPRSSGLFQRAILQSASPMMMKQMFSGSHYSRLVQLANCSMDSDSNGTVSEVIGTSNNFNDERYSVTDDLNVPYDESSPKDFIEQRLAETQCLESLPAQTLNQVQEMMVAENAISFSPTIPSVLLPDFPLELLHRKENISPKQVLLGGNSNESTLYLHQEFPNEFPLDAELNLTRSQLVHTIQRLLGNLSMTNSFVDGIFDAFARRNVTTDTEVASHFLIFLSDFIFKGPVFKFAKSWTDNTHSSVYLYQFDERVARYPHWIGPAHWMEMDFVFGLPLLYPERYTKAQRDLSIRMIQAWTHFARTGRMLAQLDMEWPILDQHNQHMNLRSTDASIGESLSMMFYQYFDLVYDAS